jgi:pyrrolidone-carboxylate peptidase
MKLTLLFFLFSAAAWGRPLVLLGHFDAFGKAPFNNSGKVAKILIEKLKDHPDFDLRGCELKTVFDKSYYQLEDCLKDLPEAPKLVLGLGESNCNFKIETMARNLDETKGPDNDGGERKNSLIIPGADKVIGLNYPLAEMYCSLGKKERADIEVSNNAGSFVCNNLAYQFSYNYPELSFGFIHVPANNCRNLEGKNQVTLSNLESMIKAAIKSTTTQRLATTKGELAAQRESSKQDQCLHEFYKRTKGADEKGFWPF